MLLERLPVRHGLNAMRIPGALLGNAFPKVMRYGAYVLVGSNRVFPDIQLRPTFSLRKGGAVLCIPGPNGLNS